VQYFAAGAGNTVRNSKESFGISFGITLIVSVANMMSSQIAQFLTRMEKNATWSQLRRSEGIKLLAFKMFNVMLFYLGAFFSFKGQHCFLEDLGLKFFTLILTDLILMNAIELFLPLIRVRVMNKFERFRNKGGDADSKQEWDVAQEYLEIFYRQFIIYIGMIVFPMMPLLGLLTNFVEFPLDKYKMLRLCKKPKRMDASMKEFILFWLIVTPFVAILCFPQGAIWAMGLHRSQFEQTDHFGNVTKSYGYGCCEVLNGHSDIKGCTFYSNTTINL